MNIFSIVFQYLKAKPLNAGLNIFLLALGIGVITTVLLFTSQLEKKITENTRGIDLVVGAKGSPLQLVLCNVLHADFPTGNIKLAEAERLATNKMVARAIPLALGDSYQAFRIIGTSHEYPALYNADLSEGQWWSGSLEAVIGSTVAEVTGLSTGDSFSSSHGLIDDGDVHEHAKYTVTGILKKYNTVMDNLILCNVESVWKVHEHEHDHEEEGDDHAEHADHVPDIPHRTASIPSTLVPSVGAGDTTREITSLLIRYRSPFAAIQLPRFINSQTNMQAASPAFEVARLFSILGVGIDILQGFSAILILVSALSIFIALYNSLKERRHDLAIMRTMGASRRKLFISVLLEGTALTLLGSLLGIGLAHAILLVMSRLVEGMQKAGIRPDIFITEEVTLLAGSMMLGILCALLPAWQASRTDISKILSQAT